MKIHIGQVIVKPSHKNQFKFVLQWMRGDADSYENQTFYCDNELECEYMYEMHQMMLNQSPSEYDHAAKDMEISKKYLLKGCRCLLEAEKNKFFSTESFNEFVEGVWDDTPWDGPCDCSCSLRDITVTYLDEEGLEHVVSFEKEQPLYHNLEVQNEQGNII